mgnify:CR=1 FL=1
MKKFITGVLALMFWVNAEAGLTSTAEQLLQDYQQQGATEADSESGKSIWYSTSENRSCSSCHSNQLKDMGKHQKTGKPIKPMALSINKARYQDSKKIEKWFLRNCKWTFGRECNVQEKSDLLSWLISQ